ncbi:MAG: zinc-ribbon domain-containing protein [Dehalococcoidia bacterium]|nr:zinc-ribbon domain-containing protein [Dehalococcoidia bacterium]
MFCSKCGKETTENSAFCAGCGASLTGGQPPKKKTQLSLAAGIIDIAAGGFSLLTLLGMVVFLFIISGVEEDMPFFIFLFPLAMLIPGVIAVVGGVFALRRRNWIVALIGSIALILTSSIPGVAALVLTVMARDEFE